MSFFALTPPVVLGPGQGTHLDVLGNAITLLVSGEQTHGAFAVITSSSPPGTGTPLHTHHDEDEALFVLEGAYDVQCGEETFRAEPGAFVFAPRGIPHKLTNASDGRSTHLGLVSPAGFEGFFEEISRLPPPPTPERIMALAAKYHLEIVGP